MPGHSPGSIGLWEASTGTLFSGDAVYDAQLLDDLPGSDKEVYMKTYLSPVLVRILLVLLITI